MSRIRIVEDTILFEGYPVAKLIDVKTNPSGTKERFLKYFLDEENQKFEKKGTNNVC